MNIQIGHGLAGLFADKENSKYSRFLELLAALKTRQRSLNVVLHKDKSSSEKRITSLPAKTP